MRLWDGLSGLVNRLTGVGTRRDRMTAHEWHYEPMQDTELLAMFQSNWMARKIVTIPVDDMLREGWRWQASMEQATKLEAEEKRLGLRDKLYASLIRDSLYGGSALIIGGGNPNAAAELVPEDIGVGGLKYLIPTGRGELEVKEFHEVIGEHYGQPKMFTLNTTKGPIDVHPSRVVAFHGQQVPSLAGNYNSTDWWGDSRLAAVTKDIGAATSGVLGMGRLMDELAVAYHKVHGLSERLAQSGGEDAVMKMMNLMSTMKSSLNSVAIDGEDEVDIVTATFAGQPDALHALMQNLSGGADIPITRFLGSSPDGMNSTGDSDTRNYYDKLTGHRSQHVEPGIAYLDKFLIRSALGSNDGSVYRVWGTLWQMTDKEQAEYDAKVIEALGNASNTGHLPVKVAQQVLKNVMIESPSFPGSEAAYKEAGENPEYTKKPAPEVPGQPPKPEEPPSRRLRVVGEDSAVEIGGDVRIADVKKIITDMLNKDS